MTTTHQAPPEAAPSRIAHTIRLFAVPIVLFWVAVAALTNVLVPQLEVVGEAHNVALSSPDSPSLQAIKRIGQKFGEFNSDSSAMVVLEGDQPLGADAHRYYDDLIKRIEQDTTHVQHVQDFWGDPLTAAGSQSSDGKAAYVQVFLSGNQGEASPWNPSTRCARSSPRPRPRRGCGPTSPARPRRSPISSRWATRAPPRSPC